MIQHNQDSEAAAADRDAPLTGSSNQVMATLIPDAPQQAPAVATDTSAHSSVAPSQAHRFFPGHG